jgi:hypothetical protein
MIRTTKEHASGIGFDVVGRFERVRSPGFWILAAFLFALLFAASQLGNKVSRLFLFWIPSLLLTTLGLTLSGLSLSAIYQQSSVAGMLGRPLGLSAYNRRILILMRLRQAQILAVLATAGGAQAQATFPLETKNAALRYWAAMAELREPIVDDDATMNLLSATFAGRVEWDEKKLGPLLDYNLDAIRTMQQATKLPESTWGFDYRHGERTPAWLLMRARRLAQLNAYEGIREMAHGDSQAAVNTWLAGLTFAQDPSRHSR